MRPDLLEPVSGDLDHGVRDVFLLVGVKADEHVLQTWTEMELLIAYDWAIREHLHASDGRVRRRAKPAFVTAAEAEVARKRLLGWPVRLENHGDGPDCCGDDLVVVCGGATPGERVAIACSGTIASEVGSAAQLLDEIIVHAQVFQHQEG